MSERLNAAKRVLALFVFFFTGMGFTRLAQRDSAGALVFGFAAFALLVVAQELHELEQAAKEGERCGR